MDLVFQYDDIALEILLKIEGIEIAWKAFLLRSKKELTFRRKYATIEDVKTDLYRYIVSICKHMPNLVMIRSTCSLYMMLIYLKRIIRLHLWIGCTKKHRNRDAFSLLLTRFSRVLPQGVLSLG